MPQQQKPLVDPKTKRIKDPHVAPEKRTLDKRTPRIMITCQTRFFSLSVREPWFLGSFTE
jgi:hypothetical protein